MPEQNTVPRVWAEEWRTRYGQALASLQVAEARVAELETALQETLWQIEHDPPLLPQAKAIAQGGLKGQHADS